jgi:hypothetical protein
MPELVAAALLALGRAPDAVVAATLVALPSLGLRCGLRLHFDRGRETRVVASRLLAALLSFGVGVALLPVGLACLGHSPGVLWAVALTTASVPLTAALPGKRSAAAAALVPLATATFLALAAGLLLLPAGFLYASPGEPVVLVELRGDSRREVVRWSPRGLPLREEGLRAHGIRIVRADGVPVGEAWLFGSAATLVGLGHGPVLLRLLAAENDAPTADSEARLYPRHSVTIAPLGALALPPWWRDTQERLLEGLGLPRRQVISSPLPLVDAQGLPVRTTYRLELDEDGSLVPAP